MIKKKKKVETTPKVLGEWQTKNGSPFKKSNPKQMDGIKSEGPFVKTRKKVAKKRVTAVKTRNAGTMSESAFWSFIRSGLRQKSRWWKPITQCKMLAKRPYKGPNKRQKFEYQCNECNNWFMEKNINVDHICPAGSLKSAQDLPGFVERLFCEIDNLQILCSSCHDKKTKEEREEKK